MEQPALRPLLLASGAAWRVSLAEGPQGCRVAVPLPGPHPLQTLHGQHAPCSALSPAHLPPPVPDPHTQAETALSLSIALGTPGSGSSEGADRCGQPSLLSASKAPLVYCVMGTAPSWLPAGATLVRASRPSALVWTLLLLL